MNDVSAKIMMDGVVVKPPPPKPITGKTVSQETSGTSGQDITVYVPSQETIKNCSNGGCTPNQIVSYYAVSSGRGGNTTAGGVVWNTGTTGAAMNTYMNGYSGFYQAPNGNYYPVGAVTPPRVGSEGGGAIPGGPTPTDGPSPTPMPAVIPGPWTKLKDSSFFTNDLLWSQIPASPVAYDADDNSQAYFIIGEAGIVGAYPEIFITGLNSGAKVSSHDWGSIYESLPQKLSPADFTSYVRGRKEMKEIDNLDQIDRDGIFIFNPLLNNTENLEFASIPSLDLTEVPAKMNQYNVVLIHEGTVNINVTGAFNPTKSVAIIAPDVNIASTVTEVKSIIVSKRTNLGDTTDQGLKIIGSLNVSTVYTNNRKWSNTNRPSLFIVSKPEMNLDLLPYLSIANYDWQQLQ
ncbi:hypothetical protein HZA76_01955 [Candidatus Roizmanbacteria bacterium]|nr:hypothetical protein [Candidatus Roizmanbacteria bacterium]